MTVTKPFRTLLVVGLIGAGWGCNQSDTATADSETVATVTAANETHEGEIVGQVVDVSCYLAQGLRGDSHRQCAEICSNDLNIPLNILDDDGNLWQLVDDDMPGRDQNPTVVQFAEQRVRATGTLIERGTNRAIIVKDVALVEGEANPTALANSSNPELGTQFNGAEKTANPCAGANPCAANPCAANPCGGANPCAANPCGAN